MEIKLSLHNIGFKQKPDKKMIVKITNQIAQCEAVYDIETVADLVGNEGHTFSPAVFRGKRKADCFQEMQLFALDFDDGINYKTVEARCEEYDLPITFAYRTFSSTEEHQKFRVVFVNDVVVDNRKAAEIMLAMLMKIFPEADPSCKDVSRMFFGGKGIISTEISEQSISIVKLAEVFQMVCFKENQKNYSRAINNFARKYNIVCVNDCLKIEKVIDTALNDVHGAGSNEKNEEFATAHPYIYGSGVVFSSKSPQYKILFGYQANVRQKERRERSGVNLKKIKEMCKLYSDFLTEDHVPHNDRFLILTNMIHMRGGEKRFLDIVEKKGYERDKWRFYVRYVKDCNYRPQSCEGNCRYCTQCDHQANMLLTVKGQHAINRIAPEPSYSTVEEVFAQIAQDFAEAISEPRKGLYLIPAQTAIGKTECYCNYICQHPEKKYVIAVPTNKLKHEVTERLSGKGLSVMETISLDEMNGIEDLRRRVEVLYSLGLGRLLKGELRSYIKRYSDSVEVEIIRAVAVCREYLKQESRWNEHAVIVTTHAKLLTMSDDMIKDYEVIIDEDIISTIFRNIRSVSVEAIKKIYGSGYCSQKMQDRMEELLNAPEDTYLKFQTAPCFDYVPEDILEAEDTLENVNDLVCADTFVRQGSMVRYFCGSRLKKGKYIVLSATLNGAIYRRYFEGWYIKEYLVPMAKYEGRLIQYTNRSMSRQFMEDHRAEIKRVLNDLHVEKYQIITFLKYFKDLSDSELHFGNTEGIDLLRGTDILILGSPHCDEFIYRLIGCYLGMEVNEDVLSVRLVEFGGYEFTFMTYKNENLRELQFYFLKKELEQCIGRARLLRYDCTVRLFSNFPCEQAELIQGDYFNKPELLLDGPQSVMAET